MDMREMFTIDGRQMRASAAPGANGPLPKPGFYYTI